MQKDIWNNEKLIKVIQENGVVVMPTDTIYGVVGKALQKEVVERIYKIKKRDREKPLIILIGTKKDLQKFSIFLSEGQEKILDKYWPGPVSLILDCLSDEFKYLHCDTKTLSFRLPFSESLRDLLLKTGPLIATSANLEGLTPAKNIDEAKKYFGSEVDFYLDGGQVESQHSKLLKLNTDNSVAVLRE